MTAPAAHIQAIGTAVPEHDVHRAYIDWASARLTGRREQPLFARMAAMSGIDHRWSVLPPAEDGGSPLGPGGFYEGRAMPSTATRMAAYARFAPDLAIQAIGCLQQHVAIQGITHLVVASCTGFIAPGLDQVIARRLGLDPCIERTLVGFMGCYGAVAAMRVAHHIARSDPQARVLVVTVELSSLHLIENDDLESLLATMQFGDGAAAALVSARGGPLRLDRFFCATLPHSDELIQWKIGDNGFEMTLSGEVPRRISHALRQPELRTVLLDGAEPQAVEWAIHPGGRSILDAVETGMALEAGALAVPRSVLAQYGNMSSSTLMFVLADLIARPTQDRGVAMAFGPGVAAEGFAYSRE